VSAARAATADAVDALTAAAAPDQPRADFESLTDADSETTGAPDVASSPRRSRWGVWLLAVILLVALVAATLWTLRPALLAFGVAPPTVARVVAPLDQMRARTMAWVADLAGVAAAPPVGDAPVNAPANAPANASANPPANAPANAAREAVPPVEVPAPPPVAAANPPTLAPSDDAVGRQMAAALARLADDGDGDPAAEAWAAQTLREAAIEGLAEAQYALAVLYQRGRGVSQDPVRALLWYHSAAEQGHAPAQYNLGVFHLEAQGVPRNYAEARRWFTRAADQRLWQAEFNLGVLRERGVLGAPDLTAAEAHYRQAEALGGAPARARLAALAAGETAAPVFLSTLDLGWATRD
ncbi:MAG: tetratricopeptide repeat protein, partial [Pseudomonadota bacterium]|nr:tetratricopeptide repeat protein [Pseudomonadota bacterium]